MKIRIILDIAQSRVPRPCRVSDRAGIWALLLQSEIYNLQST